MPGRVYNQLVEIAADHHGYVTQADARAAGIAPMTLARMAQRGTLQRTSHGVYRVPAIPPGPLDLYMEATLWPRGPRGVLSHETALTLQDLSDVDPERIHVTVPRAHRVVRAIPKLYRVHHADLADDEITLHEGIPITTPARAILDCHATGLGPALLEQAIADARARGLITLGQAHALRHATRESAV